MKITKTQLKQMIEEEISGLDEGFLDTMKDIQSAMGFGRSTEVEPSAPAAPVDPKVACKSECDAKFQDAIAKTDGQARFSRKYHKCMEYCVAEKARPAAPVQRDTGQTSGCNCNTLHRPGTKCGKICAKRLGVDPNAPLSAEERARIRAIRNQTDQDIAQKNRAAYDQEQADRQRVADEIDAKNRADQKRRDDLRRKRNPYNRRRPSRGTSFGGGGMGESINKDDLYGIIEEELSAFLAEMKD